MPASGAFAATQATDYLPAERASETELRRHIALFQAMPLANLFLDAGVGFAAILNKYRQVVYVNSALADYLRDHGHLQLGLRPGEALDCVHGRETAGGCGTTEACRFCGAAHSIAAAIHGLEHVEECRIQTHTSGEDLNLLVRATPFEHQGEKFVILAALDISHEKRRRWLERLFFHDIVNTAGSIKGLADLLTARPQEEYARKYAPLLSTASAALLDDIAAQRDVAAAERNEIVVQPSLFRVRPLLNEVASCAMAHRVGLGKTVEVAASTEDVLLHSDRRLLMRVLANLIKNGLEAEPKGSAVTVSAWQEELRVVFEVHNPAVMLREVALQVFQRSFSTKGADRGLGTYSVRLLSERYLGGRVTMNSEPGQGTVFRTDIPIRLP